MLNLCRCLGLRQHWEEPHLQVKDQWPCPARDPASSSTSTVVPGGEGAEGEEEESGSTAGRIWGVWWRCGLRSFGLNLFGTCSIRSWTLSKKLVINALKDKSMVTKWPAGMERKPFLEKAAKKLRNTTPSYIKFLERYERTWSPSLVRGWDWSPFHWDHKELRWLLNYCN